MMQAIKACNGDIEAGLKEFEAKRLPDVHALFALDVQAIPRFGSGPWGKWDPRFWVNKFHLGLWGGLSKALPGLIGQPELIQMSTQKLPYSQVGLTPLAAVSQSQSCLVICHDVKRAEPSATARSSCIWDASILHLNLIRNLSLHLELLRQAAHCECDAISA